MRYYDDYTKGPEPAPKFPASDWLAIALFIAAIMALSLTSNAQTINPYEVRGFPEWFEGSDSLGHTYSMEISGALVKEDINGLPAMFFIVSDTVYSESLREVIGTAPDGNVVNIISYAPEGYYIKAVARYVRSFCTCCGAPGRIVSENLYISE